MADRRERSQLGTLIVTGASRGTARLAAVQGYAFAVNYANDRTGAEGVAEAIAASGGGARVVRGDVANEEDVVELFARAERELGPITGLVNNAGTTGGSSRVADLSLGAPERTLAVNVTGAFSGAAHGAFARRRGWIDRQRFVARRETWRWRGVGALCGE